MICLKSPLISVIVPVYKVEPYIEECVRSICDQTYQNLEILLVDDGSPDNCPEMCDKYAAEDGRIKVIHKANGGLADARNTGLAYASGDLIAFVDGDDWLAADAYEKMVDMFREEHGLDIVCCAAVRVRNGKDVENVFSYYPTGTVKGGREITKRILLVELGSQAVIGLYKNKCWDAVRFPKGRIYEDIPTTFKAFFKAARIGFIDEPFYKYRLNDEGISNTPKAIKPYHIYLGFKEHYLCAAEHFPDIAVRCCGNVGHYAISTYFHYCSERSAELETVVEDVRTFMDEHKAQILQDQQIPGSRKLALRLYYFSDGLFKLFCRVFHMLGLQKKLGFDMK